MDESHQLPLWKRKTFRIAACCVGFLLICFGVTAVVYREQDLPERQGKLVFEDLFERDSVGDLYRVAAPDPGYKAGEWKIEDGRLRAEKIHNATLWLQKELPEKVRVEFDVEALSSEGDTKCEIFGDGQTHQSGYILIRGGWSNSINCIARQDEHGEDRKEDRRCPVIDQHKRCVEPNTQAHWTIERTDRELRWYIDQKLFLTFDDRHPLDGRFLGFNDWEAPVLFDNLRIYDLSN